MSAYVHTVTSARITNKRCKLLSVVLSQEAQGTGTVRIYDGMSAMSDRLALELYQDGDGSCQFRFDGLIFDRGMYVEIYNRVDHVTVEWESLAEKPQS